LAIAALADAGCIVLFAALGRASHDEGSAIGGTLAVAAPFWKDIDRMEESEREACEALRMVYGPALLNGPFAILFGHGKGLIGMNDRIKLRPFIAATKGKTVYMASEESAIREICPDPEKVWAPRAGQPVSVELGKGII